MDGIGTQTFKILLTCPEHIFGKNFQFEFETWICLKMLENQKSISLYQGDLKTDPSNFRPISILPIPMKIFEKIVHDQVSEFIKESYIFI